MPIGNKKNRNAAAPRTPLLKKLFWAYFLLLIFEGALRKWIVPQLSAPLLLVRDPVGMFIIWEAYRTHKWPSKWTMLTGVLTVGLIGLCIVQAIGYDNPWFVGLYGLRTYLLPFPVAFVMGENLDQEDLRKFGVCTLWLLLPLTALEILQYSSGAGSIWNIGASEGGHQIGYTGEHVRASATFSYVTGPINFIPLAAAFLFYGLVNKGFAKRWLLFIAAAALICSVPVIGSRTLVFELGGLLICLVIGALFGISQFGQLLKVAFPILIVFYLVALLPIFSDASKSLNRRFEEASDTEGGTLQQTLVSRTFGQIEDRIAATDYERNPFGIGIGKGANAMSVLLVGAPVFLAGEDEFSREVNEMGPIPGILFLLVRCILGLTLMGRAIACSRDQAPLALLLAPLFISTLLFGVLEQPTSQGFMVIGIAFAIAALKMVVIPLPLPFMSGIRVPVRPLRTAFIARPNRSIRR